MNYELATNTWDDDEINAIMRLIDKRQFSMGDSVKEYEQKFAKFFGSNYAVMTNSGSTANLLMIAALFLQKTQRTNYVVETRSSSLLSLGQRHIFHCSNMA